MRRAILNIVCICICLFVFASYHQVKADLIVFPEDRFLNAHEDECTYEYRRYIANSINGYVYYYQNPESKIMIATAENGANDMIEYIYVDSNNESWGYTQSSSAVLEKGEKGAWVQLKDWYVKYDHTSFIFEFIDQIVQDDIEFDINEGKKKIYLWTYPESGESSGTIQPNTEYALSYPTTFDMYYEDSIGRKWIYIGYYMTQSGWICIDDSTNSNIKKNERIGVEPEVIYPSVSPTIRNQMEMGTTIIVVVTLVVVGGTAFVIERLYKKNRQ